MDRWNIRVVLLRCAVDDDDNDDDVDVQILTLSLFQGYQVRWTIR